MTCRNHPDLERVNQHHVQRIAELEALVGKMTNALDRYGRHEHGCRFSRSHGHSACTCQLHDRIREGGLKP
ncbi:hypothetical protein [Myxococcus sp. CA040A]|uniref:hypothetical protein n=1 Tax=Myxococcus sp. CA040A TaxID=2741738 RepID=UPI00157B96E8|nr:hypothetical protein [Myxococcus sp. CA040A]NTX08291.1 hypothetical protein [Myxococcus sp. CA040A]